MLVIFFIDLLNIYKTLKILVLSPLYNLRNGENVPGCHQEAGGM